MRPQSLGFISMGLLSNCITYIPGDYRSAADKIPDLYGRQAALSVDFSNLEICEATKLAAFCCGVTTHPSGWIFRVAQHVIIMIPVEH